MNKIRKIPPVCLCIALARLMTGSLQLSKEHVGEEIVNKQGNTFRIFRNIFSRKVTSSNETAVFIVNFKFARLSHKANKVASIIPMLLIAGFPGFIQKMYAVDKNNGYWQGMYQWKTQNHLEEYLKSFVYKMMKKRAIAESIQTEEYECLKLNEYIDTNLIK